MLRQSANLVARAATVGGHRAPLASVLDQFFVDLVDALARQGLRQKVIADMFGVTTRTYYARLKKLEETGLEPGRTLWQDVLRFVQAKRRVARPDVMDRFRTHDEAVIRSILKDLVESGLVYQAGSGARTRYIPADTGTAAADTMDVLTSLVHACVETRGPVGREAVATELGFPQDMIDETLEMLEEVGAVRRADDSPLAPFIARRDVEVDDRIEAAVFAFFQGLQRAVDAAADDQDAAILAATVEVWNGHPDADEVRELVRRLAEIRRDAGEPPEGAPTYRLVVFASEDP